MSSKFEKSNEIESMRHAWKYAYDLNYRLYCDLENAKSTLNRASNKTKFLFLGKPSDFTELSNNNGLHDVAKKYKKEKQLGKFKINPEDLL